MKLGTRIFFCYLLIFAACFYYPIDWMVENLRIRYLEGVEDPLVDQANILASIVGCDMESGRLDTEKLHETFENLYARPISAKIYEFEKKRVDVRVYATDVSGTIFFDSEDRYNTGLEYAKWRDVHLTLVGEYGARTSLRDRDDPKSSVLYVAAPIFRGNDIAGSLTVAKPTTNINNFLQTAKPKITRIGTISMIVAVVLSLLVSFWITRPIKRLTRYANDISQGKRPKFPKLDRSEIGEMGKAFERMQEALEGKKYVEKYVQNLTHEIKSPLSAIRGAAELLREKMDDGQRVRFLTNIHNETDRIQVIVDRMLELSALEARKKLDKIETVFLDRLVATVIESQTAILSQKGLSPVVTADADIRLSGDAFLLQEAISNLVQNAADFSPANGRLDISVRAGGKAAEFLVEDCGPGIPEFAMEKIFDKFFSLQRPDSGKKSTGLGLNFVKEVAMLHGGELKVENRHEGGVRALMVLPVPKAPD